MKPTLSSPRRKRWRVLRPTLIVLAIAGLILGLVVDHILVGAILHPLRQGTTAPLPRGIEERSFPVSGGIELKAWMARPEGEPVAVVFVLHGISDSKASQAGPIAFLAERGIVGIAPDLRAHGSSGGDAATYGYFEKRDMSGLRQAVEKEFPGVPVGLWGTSYGGAVALQAIGADPEFDFAIIESTFADLREMSRQQVRNRTSLPITFLGPYYMNRAGKEAGFDPGMVSPETSIENVKAPLLHMHGTLDEVIPFAHGQRIASHAKSPNYRFVPIEGGTHYHLQDGDPETYRRERDAFLDRVAPRR